MRIINREMRRVEYNLPIQWSELNLILELDGKNREEKLSTLEIILLRRVGVYHVEYNPNFNRIGIFVNSTYFDKEDFWEGIEREINLYITQAQLSEELGV